ncbi:MAG: hypothetical protein K1Y02_14260 [Candidatus Hydrogenedentes bacterium]|nr:hypothetical protein [Candidatus Hydrogenedentota bacterium]
MDRKSRSISHIAVAVAIAAFASSAAFAQAQERYHGVALDENHRLIIEQLDNVCRIGIIERGRFSGPDLTDVVEPKPGQSARVTPEPTYLLEIRSEVVVPSAPNYLQNPGERYRISIQTVDLTPPYENQFEVWAEPARDAVLYEFYKLSVEHTGIERKALEAAGPLVLEIFKEAQVLPAEIYASVLRSRSGLFRITPETRQRRKILPPQTFAPRPDFGRPELGATKRERQRRMLPTGATAPGAISAPTPGVTPPTATLNEPVRPRAVGPTQSGPNPPGASTVGKIGR